MNTVYLFTLTLKETGSWQSSPIKLRAQLVRILQFPPSIESWLSDTDLNNNERMWLINSSLSYDQIRLHMQLKEQSGAIKSASFGQGWELTMQEMKLV